jgi:tol-pal system protein YbgF
VSRESQVETVRGVRVWLARGVLLARGPARFDRRPAHLRSSPVEFTRGALCALVFASAACAPAAPAHATPGAQAANDVVAQVAALQQKLEDREQLVTQLESRLSLLEAEQRQLRFAIAERESAPVGLRETVRIGGHEEHVRESKREQRPVLRLYEERRTSEAALAPIPQVDERLPVAPLPDMLGLAKSKAEPQAPADGVEAHGSAREQNKDPYLSAIDLVRRRDFPAALAALARFIAMHPEDARLARAEFWRGEVLFAQKSYATALSAFESSLKQEPKGEKAPDSLLKIGLCHKRLGAPERARAAIQQLKIQFPQSSAARLAQAEEA